MAYEECFNKWYGIEFDVTNADPAVTRIAEDMNCHISTVLPVHNAMKGCLLNDNGTVNYYLNPTNWAQKSDTNASSRNGSDGQVVMEIPAHYELYESAGNIRRVKFCLVYKQGFRYVPKMYIGAYKATLNRTTSKLASVVNTTDTYRGGGNQAGMNGFAATEISQTSFRTYARNRGVNWSMYSYQAWKKIYWLFAIEYATRDSQKAVDPTYTTEGYCKGGLGAGVATVNGTDWGTFNGYYPLIPCGTSDSLGNASGEVAYSIPSFPGSTGAVKVPRYRGVENPFGEIFEWVDGINFQCLQTQQTAKAYIIDNPNHFGDDGANIGKAREVFNVSKVSGYGKTIAFGPHGDIIPSDAGSSGTGSSTYFPDYFEAGYVNNCWGWRALLVGGAATYGLFAGLGFAYSFSAASASDAAIGSRLCFLGS